MNLFFQDICWLSNLCTLTSAKIPSWSASLFFKSCSIFNIFRGTLEICLKYFYHNIETKNSVILDIYLYFENSRVFEIYSKSRKTVDNFHLFIHQTAEEVSLKKLNVNDYPRNFRIWTRRKMWFKKLSDRWSFLYYQITKDFGHILSTLFYKMRINLSRNRQMYLTVDITNRNASFRKFLVNKKTS